MPLDLDTQFIGIVCIDFLGVEILNMGKPLAEKYSMVGNKPGYRV